MVEGERTTDHGRQTMDHGRQMMDHGRQTMDHGPRTTDDGECICQVARFVGLDAHRATHLLTPEEDVGAVAFGVRFKHEFIANVDDSLHRWTSGC